MSDFFSSIEFGSYGPIQNKTLKLTRFHALIGPNDSGKSMALRGLSRAAKTDMIHEQFRVRAVTRNGLRFGEIHGGQAFGWSPNEPPISARHRGWSGGRFLRLDPDEMRAPYPLFSDSDPLRFLNDRGAGLGALLDAVLARSRKTFDDISTRFVELFPTVEEFSFSTHNGGRRIGVKLKSGERVPAEFMSEGMLYYLAFVLLPHLEPTSVLLIEEPENGLHPARIADVVKVLREVSKTTQVVMATHSPLVVNELQPDEVTLVTRTEAEGTKFTPIASTPNFERRSSAFALGELWLSYADGVTEAPLFEDVKATGTK